MYLKSGLLKLVYAATIAGFSLILVNCGQSSEENASVTEQAAPPAPQGMAENAPPPPAAMGPGQDGAPPPQGGGMSRVDQALAAITDMTEEQVAQVKSIMEGTEDAIKNLQTTMPEWNDASMAEFKKLWDREAENVQAVLSEAQLAQYDEWSAAFRGEREQDEH